MTTKTDGTKITEIVLKINDSMVAVYIIFSVGSVQIGRCNFEVEMRSFFL